MSVRFALFALVPALCLVPGRGASDHVLPTMSVRVLNAPDALVRSAASGAWSDGKTWEGGKVPGAGARVQIRTGHTVTFDVKADAVIRSIHVAGTLTFARDRDTALNVGLIKIQPGDDASENGFDCDAHAKPVEPGTTRPALEVGTLAAPIPSKFTATIRLHHVEGLDKETCPAIVCCGGRMDLHGAPMERTWVKLAQMARSGEARIVLPYPLPGWKVGDRIVVVGTSRQVGYLGTRKLPTDDSIRGKQSSEERVITKMASWGGSGLDAETQWQIVTLDAPLKYEHRASGSFRAEVANLSRNVVVESANPDGIRGHTMYHRNSAGGISYAEFRHLGKENVLGKYPIHYHLCGDTMRGSSVIGVSVWGSKNRFVTVHGTRHLVVRDCVGYDSIGHGFFLEDGTEAFNVFDRNLAVLACRGKPLPDQVLPFDKNLGSGFWWSNSLNTFTRNVAAECDEDGFRFEVVKTAKFDPVLNVPGADGARRSVDVRTLPFVRFDGNESHTHRLFAFNLGGFATTEFGKPDSDVGGVGPDAKHPLVIRNLKVWDAHWGFHTGCPRVLIEGAEFYDCLYGMWRCVLDGHEHKRVTYTEVENPLFFPRHAASTAESGTRPYPESPPVDDLAPTTVITHTNRLENGNVRVRGTTSDNFTVKRVVVNGREARAVRSNFAEWEIELPSAVDGKVSARAEDATGNIESQPHAVTVRTK
ncbi:G8 domain protein [Gemmata sp. SH-PL17]|uniref:G8 domain-containing protein n=1 Tax=Gemmata sp. SH-PL17 TaxID=1630693 RepID=UPI00078CF720|nr:G8 domain-containing protein [Gemmata sp. SH-PL17]AMV25711.1 G8 domain protein [Gemmata sp. SH-PL17]